MKFLKQLKFCPFVLLTILLFNFSTTANTDRLEIKLNDGFKNEEVIPLGKSGFVIMANLNNHFKFDFYDSELKYLSMKELSLRRKLKLKKKLDDDENVILILKNDLGIISLIIINKYSLHVNHVQAKLPLFSEVYDYALIDNLIVLCYSLRQKTYFFAKSFKTGEVKIIPVKIKGYNTEKIVLERLQYLEKINKVMAFARVSTAKKSKIYVAFCDNDANISNFNQILGNVDQAIIDISCSINNNGNFVFGGTYIIGSGNVNYFAKLSKGSGKNIRSGRSLSATGLFISEVSSSLNEVIYFKYYKYVALKDAFKYQPSAQMKAAYKVKKGKDVKRAFRVADHEIIPLNDDYLFVGEVFNVIYKSVNRNPAFYAYNYTNAIIAQYDTNGHLLWHHIYEMMYNTVEAHHMRTKRKTSPDVIKNFVNVNYNVTDEIIKLNFVYQNLRHSTTLTYQGETLEDKHDDVLRHTDNCNIKFTKSYSQNWYDDYIIVYGSQIVNCKKSKKKKIFFVDKVDLSERN